MKKTLLVTLFTLAAVTLGARQQAQEIRMVTSDVVVGGPGLLGSGPPMATGSGVVFGQVKEADSDRPVSGAIVTLNLPGAQPLRVMADAQGRFGFRDLPKGAFNISATRPGWVDGAYGRTRPGGPTLPLLLTDGERVSGVTVGLWRYASIAGRIVDDSGDALVNMPVRVLKRSTIGGKTRFNMVQADSTDDRGIYRVGNLEPGDYLVVVPMQQPFAELPMMIEGDMVRAVAATRVSAMAGGGGGNMVFFNDASGNNGAAGLGEDGRPLSFPTVFYPNVATSTRATVITLTTGEERAAVDFQLKGVPTSKVSGVAMGPDGFAPNLQLTLVNAEADESATGIETLSGSTDQQGRFTIDGVPPGQYILRAVRTPRVAMSGGEVTTFQQGGATMVMRVATAGNAPPLPTEPTLWAELSVAVGVKDVTDLSVALRTGVKMSGLVQFNGGAEKPLPERMGSVNVSLEPADQRAGVSAGRGRIDSTGTFATVGVPPGRYFVRVGGAYQGWTFQSAMVNGRDASVVPVEFDSADLGGVMLTFTDRPSELSGQVQSDGPLEGATVLVFPAESSAWVGYGSGSRRFSSTRADKQGNFKIMNLPAGDYLAVAIPDKMANDWQNPKFLETLVPEAARVHVRDGDKVTASLKVSR